MILNRHEIGRGAAATLLAGLLAVAATPAFATASGSLRAVASGQPIRIDAAVAITPTEGEVTDGQDRFYEIVRASVREALARTGRHGRSDERLTLKIAISFGHPGAPMYERDGRFVRGGAPQPPFDSSRTSGPFDAEVIDQIRVPLGTRSAAPDTNLALALFLYDRRGAALWTATVTASGEITDPAYALARMTRAAMAVIGANSERNFLLWCDGVEPGDRGLCLD